MVRNVQGMARVAAARHPGLMQPQPPPQDDPWLPWQRTQPTDAPYPTNQGVPYRSVNAYRAEPEPPVLYQPVPMQPSAPPYPVGPYGQPYPPPPPYYPQPQVVVNVTSHPQMGVTTPYISPAFHVVNILLSVFTCVWTPVYLYLWWRKSRPTSITTYR